MEMEMEQQLSTFPIIVATSSEDSTGQIETFLTFSRTAQDFPTINW